MGATIAVATGVGALANMYSAKKSSEAVGKAADTASATERYMFDKSVELQEPWRKSGENALNALNYMLSQDLWGGYKKSPGYEARLAEGANQIENYLASRGLSNSGYAGKALLKYGQDYATQDYDNYLNRFYQGLNPWLSMAGMGQTSATNTGSQAMQLGSSLASNELAKGNARASGYTGMANSVTGGIQSGLNNYMAYQNYDMLKNYLANPPNQYGGYGTVPYGPYQ